MAEIVLSALLPIVFEKLASVVVKITRSNEIESELKKWKMSLSEIQYLLNDASKKEITNESVKQWLNNLQHLAYDIDDVLDDFEIEAMHRDFTEESQSMTNKIRKLVPACFTRFSSSTMMNGKLYYITTRLQELLDEKSKHGLIVTDGRPQNKSRRYQTSLVDAPCIVGREGDKEELLHKLIDDESCNRNFCIVPIVGMGGIGKTTLARLLYDEVKDHFKFKAWVCVSDEFDSFHISKVIFQSLAGENKEFADLNLLQVALGNLLNGERFLLVLDDVWSESIEDWETLVGPFLATARGSKVIITTRKENLLKKLGYNHPYNLKKLSHKDSLSLFAQHALGVNNFDSHPTLRPYGEGIVQKCDGLPLALKALGSLLRTKTDEEGWEELLNSEIWRLQDGGGIVPALRLSYHDLSACLKQLFAYCSLFAKDYLFEKENLILLWMAEGYLHQSTSSKSMERLGEEYFEELLSRSFFQRLPDDKSLYVMHDLMNDLATSVAGEFFVRFDTEIEKGNKDEASEKYRHMSFVRERFITYNKLKAFERANSLRTFLVVPIVDKDGWDLFYISNKILVDLLPAVPLLRVLCLSRLAIEEVPESIGNLKHLRYLNLSRSKITQLPENVCNLYKLQTLIIFGCDRLTKLPQSFSKLKHLRHFDIRDTLLLDTMPLGIGDMKSLQTLPKIIIRGDKDFSIAGLKNLKKLSELQLEQIDVFDDSQDETLEKKVLDMLKPHHHNLKNIKFVSYGGTVFPNWVGDPSFLWLTHISISKCRKCMDLPPLGQLPSLKELHIQKMDAVKIVGSELLGTGLAFPSLEILFFEDMMGWEVWETYSGGVGAVFPCLQILYIENCPNLVEVSLKALPSLRILDLHTCGDSVLRSLVRVASSVTRLSIRDISGLTDEVWGGVIRYLDTIEYLHIDCCNEIRYLCGSEGEASRVLVNLRTLYVWRCNNFMGLGVKEHEEDNCGRNLLKSLRNLNLWQCNNLEHCSCPSGVEDLSIHWCPSITSVSLPTGGCQKLKSLEIKECNQLLENEMEKVLLNTNMPKLEVVIINHWSNLQSIVALTSFVHLAKLNIVDCPSIESFPACDLSNLTLLKHLTIKNCPSMDAPFLCGGSWPPGLCSLYIGGLKKPISEWGPRSFPTSLVDLELWGGPPEGVVTSGSQISHILPSSLTELLIAEYMNLESLSMELNHLTSLQHLYIEKCPEMKHLPEMLLPSLLSLTIRECPNLKEKSSRGGSYWPLISFIPFCNIN